MTNSGGAMSTNRGGEGPEGRAMGLLRATALVAVLIGAAASFGFMLRVGHRNPSRLLVALFTVWVLSPFVALVWGHIASKRWPLFARKMLYSVMLVLALASVAIYGDVALGAPKAKPAFAFLAVPLASWLVLAVVVALVARLTGKSIGVQE